MLCVCCCVHPEAWANAQYGRMLSISDYFAFLVHDGGLKTMAPASIALPTYLMSTGLSSFGDNLSPAVLASTSFRVFVFVALIGVVAVWMQA
jgi:hypothetical protein